jgi:hypothetical protein
VEDHVVLAANILSGIAAALYIAQTLRGLYR